MKRQSIASRLPKLRAVAFAPLTVLLGMPLAYAADSPKLSNSTFDAGVAPWVTSKNVASVRAANCNASNCLQLTVKGAAETATSEVITVSPSDFIAVSAKMKRTLVSGQNEVSLEIVFYDTNNAPITTATRRSYLTEPDGTWGDVKVSAIAPAGTKTAQVVIRSHSAGTLTAYVDDVVMSKIVIENKGQQVYFSRVSAAAIDANTLYVAANGNPAKFAYYIVANGEKQKDFTLGNEDIWSVVVGGDSVAYFGTASGKLYKYAYNTDPAPVIVHEFKKAKAGTRTIWSLKAGPNNCIYGGLAPDEANTSGFKYCSATKEITMLPVATQNGVTPAGYHIRSLAVDLGGANIPRSIYWGMGNPARLYKSAIDGSNLTGPLDIDATKEYAYYTDFVKDRAFVRLTGKGLNQTVVLKRSDTSPSATLTDINSIGVSPLSPPCTTTVSSPACENTVFYTKDLGVEKGSRLSSYRLDLGKETDLNIGMSSPTAFAFAPFKEPSQLVSVLREPVDGFGKIVRYNLSDLYTPNNDAKSATTDFLAPVTASAIRTLVVHNGKMYSSGYVNGGIGIGDETSKPSVVVREPLQAEGMAVLGERLYLGGYPGAVLKSYELTKDGALGAADLPNTELGDVHGQNRPFAMLALPHSETKKVDRLVIATVPKVNQQGALAVYTVGERFPWSVLKEPFKDQSVLALAKIENVVYGGTSAWRDLDNKKDLGFAKLFTFNPDDLTVKKIDFKGDIVSEATWDKLAITALLGVKRQLWILAEDTVFIYDHDTNTIVNKLPLGEKFSYKDFQIVWNAGSMVESNGYVYIYANDTKTTNVYRVNISKPNSVELIRKGESGMLNVDAKGNIYMLNEEEIVKYNMPLP